MSGFLTLALALSGLSIISEPANAATGKHPVSVSLKVSASKVKSGRYVKVSGVVKDKVTKKPIKGVRVVIQQRLTKSSKWVKVVTRKTSAKGTYSARIRETRSVSVRAVVTATSRTKSGKSSLKRVSAIQSITLFSRKDKVPTNEDKRGYSVLTYLASPGLRGKTMKLQSRWSANNPDIGWESYWSAKVPASGRVTFKVNWTCGEISIDKRAIVESSPGVAQTVSPRTTQYYVLCEDWRVAEREADRRAEELEAERAS